MTKANKKKVGRPKVKAADKIVPLSIGVPKMLRSELLAEFKAIVASRKNLTNEIKQL